MCFHGDDETSLLTVSQRSFSLGSLRIRDSKMPSTWLRNAQQRRKSALRGLRSSVRARGAHRRWFCNRDHQALHKAQISIALSMDKTLAFGRIISLVYLYRRVLGKYVIHTWILDVRFVDFLHLKFRSLKQFFIFAPQFQIDILFESYRKIADNCFTQKVISREI